MRAHGEGHEPIGRWSMPPRRRRRILLGLGTLVILGLVVGWLLYNAIWGFGGLYTVYYLPTPDKLISASIGAPGGDLSTAKRNAVYRVQQPLDELVAFYQTALLNTGWTIMEQGSVNTTPETNGYCIVTEQRGIRADIFLVGRPGDPVTAVFIHFDDPTYCDSPLRRSR